ncbi:phosphotransferase [Streptomyces sp. SCUT-3]|uniref:phosphotransferase enzyme family protein n=1 Tax=Streptomyces sp. SCUT-3 TaxID=2684469 RepID=UPI000CAC64F6|nr:phosphotransferase [Streptomyces sp. SCUT-3]PLW73431.1 vgr-related protein [Streptomyces sp. DJ]QMV21029.1 phosphotransferase [Streptomyces sp. SCUT-3]
MSALEPGSATWVAGLLASEWGVAHPGGLRPLTSGGEQPLTHTAGLWEYETGGRAFVLKAQLNPDAARPAGFYPLKRDLVARCRAAGVPAAEVLPTVRGEAAAWRDGVVCEVLPRCPGTSPHHSGPDAVRAVLGTALRLRRTLDALPARTVEELARMPVNPLVDQEDPHLALEEATGLLPAAEARPDPWGRLVAGALRELLGAAHLLADAPAPVADAVVHADLHRHHFLLGPDGVTAVLDFDNARAGDRLLDLAWAAELCLSVPAPGDRAGPALLAGFIAECRAEGLLAEGEHRLLMPLLYAAAAPVIVDIAKDVLVRDILSPAWARYFELLSPLRRAGAHALLTGG